MIVISYDVKYASNGSRKSLSIYTASHHDSPTTPTLTLDTLHDNIIHISLTLSDRRSSHATKCSAGQP